MTKSRQSIRPIGPLASPRIVLFANTDWYLYNFRLSLARRLVQRLGAKVWVACPDGPHRTALESEGFQWIPVSMRRRSLNPLHDLAEARRLSRHLQDIRPDLIHAFTLKSIFIGNLAARLAGVPRTINAFTGLGSLYGGRSYSYGLVRGFLALFFRVFLCGPGTRTVFQNLEDLRQIKAATGSADQFRLIPGSGVDIKRFHPVAKPPDFPVVLLACRLIRDKGIAVLCHAATLVVSEIPEVQFWIAGQVDLGNPSSYTQEEIAHFSIEYPAVRFLGHRPDMPDLCRRATLAVLPALSREGLPRSLIEACASGLALVASDIEGIREVVLPGCNGILLPPGDANALATALLQLLKDPHRRAAMGRESRGLALERFDEEKILEATLAVYAELGLQPASEEVR